MRDQNNRVMRVLFPKAFDFMEGSLGILEEDKPAVLTSSRLAKIHLNKVFGLFQVFMNDILLDFAKNNGFSFDSSEVSFMLHKVNDARLWLSVQNQIFCVVNERVSLSIFGGFEDFIDFDWISFVIVLYSEQKNGSQQDVKDDADR